MFLVCDCYIQLCFSSQLRMPESKKQKAASCVHLLLAAFCNKCERGDLNPHPLRDTVLSRARLPIPPLSRNSNKYDNGKPTVFATTSLSYYGTAILRSFD